MDRHVRHRRPRDRHGACTGPLREAAGAGGAPTQAAQVRGPRTLAHPSKLEHAAGWRLRFTLQQGLGTHRRLVARQARRRLGSTRTRARDMIPRIIALVAGWRPSPRSPRTASTSCSLVMLSRFRSPGCRLCASGAVQLDGRLSFPLVGDLDAAGRPSPRSASASGRRWQPGRSVPRSRWPRADAIARSQSG